MASRLVVDASPLIFLTRVGLLEVLREPADEVIVPDVVLDEINSKGPDGPTTIAIRATPWIPRVASGLPSPDSIAWDLDAGETAVLGLAPATPGSIVAIDGLAARRTAKALGVPFLGTLALISIAKAIGTIPSVRPIIDRLRESGIYLPDSLARRVLEQAGG